MPEGEKPRLRYEAKPLRQDATQWGSSGDTFFKYPFLMQLGWSGPRAAVDPVSRKRGVPGVSEQRPLTLEAINWSSLLLERFQSTSLRLPENKGGMGTQSRQGCPSR